MFGGGPNNNFSLTMNGGGQYKTAPGTADPIDFSAQKAYFQSLSSTLSHMTSTGTCTFDGFSTTTCTATAAGINVINVADPTILGTSRTVNINLGTNSFVVINVAGGVSSADYMSNYGFNIYQNGVKGLFKWRFHHHARPRCVVQLLPGDQSRYHQRGRQRVSPKCDSGRDRGRPDRWRAGRELVQWAYRVSQLRL